MAIILGIDPGSRVTGYGVIRRRTAVELPWQRMYPHQSRRSAVAAEADIRRRHRNYYPVPARLFRYRAGLYGEKCRFGVEAWAGARSGDCRGDEPDLPVLSTRLAVKQTVVGIGSAEKSGTAYGAYFAETSGKSAGGCGGCIGHRHHPLPPQSEPAQISETRLNLARGRLR